MSDPYADEDVIRRVLTDSTTWAFVGLRDNPGRTAYDMAELLKSRGKTIVPVHPAAESVLGEPGVPSLAKVTTPVNVVGVYRRAAHAGCARITTLRPDARAGRADDGGTDGVLVLERVPALELAAARRRADHRPRCGGVPR